MLILLAIQVCYSQSERDFYHHVAVDKPMVSVSENKHIFYDDITADSPVGKKGVGLAAFYSLLLPGMGELYVGDYSTGKYSTIAEAALWIGWSGFQLYGNWQQDDARNFSVRHASVTLANKDDLYFANIENFPSVYAYNSEMLRERQPYSVYNPQSSSYWNWDSDVNRERYRQLRISSDETFNSSRYVLAAIVVNHVLSAVSATRMAIAHNNELDNSGGLDIHARIMGNIASASGVMISVSKSF